MQAPEPVLAVVDRRQELLALDRLHGSVADALGDLMKVIKGLPSPSAGLPRKVVNRLVDRWVN